MKYTKIFDVKATEAKLRKSAAEIQWQPGDRRDGLVYLYTDEIELTINVGLATGRPIHLGGKSGAGKSSLARNVALRLGRRYYEEVITSRTQHSDLFWRFDLLRRFRDAGVDCLKLDAEYIEPRAFWWAFNPELAAHRGLRPPGKPEHPAVDPSPIQGEDSVILLDEIDKADPDVPNNLLVTLGSAQFTVPYLNDLLVESKTRTIVFITSNDERDLPAAFLRRCVTLELDPPSTDRLVEIAAKHFGDSRAKRDFYRTLAHTLYPDDTQDPDAHNHVSTAEYLDAVSACKQLDVEPKRGDPAWETLVRVTVRKAGLPAGFEA